MPGNISTKINHVDEYILNIVWGHDLHDRLFIFSSSNFSLGIWRGQVYYEQCMDQPVLALVERKDVCIGQKGAPGLFSPHRRSFG